MGGLILPMSQHSLIENETDVKINIVIGSITILFGLVSIAFGEIIGVLFAIEENTRKNSIKI